MSDETGEWILNSRVAHIKARSEGGPRWDPTMDEEENRSADNLLALCEPHAFEIDATPDHYPVELLRDWKKAQLEEYRELGKSWPLNKSEARDVASRSFEHREQAAAQVSAASMVEMARLVATMIEIGRLQRREPTAAALAWQRARERTSRSFPVYNLDGERMAVEPPLVETRAHQARLEEALEAAATTLTPTATRLVGELHGLRAIDARLDPWCQWVRGATDVVVAAAGYWPGRPPLADDGVWEQALSELLRASDALTATWRGEPADEPPLVVKEPASTEESDDEHLAAQAHRALLDSAQPWARVPHRPFDPDLCQRLMSATRAVVSLPSLPSLVGVGLRATARLAACVARNADDDTFADLIDKAATTEPLACSVTLLRSLMMVARDEQRVELESQALTQAQALLRAENWQTPTTWTANGPHCLGLLHWTAEAMSVDEVHTVLTTAIEGDADMLSIVLPAMAEWCEHRDSQDPRRVTGASSRIESLPAWFPLGPVVEEIHRRLPGVAPGDEDSSEAYSDETDKLASQVLWIAAQGNDPIR